MLATNLGRGAEFVGVFEIGRGYGVDAAGARQEPRSVALLLYGTWPPCGAERRGPAISFFDAKGTVENVIERLGVLVPHAELLAAGWPTESDPDPLWLKPHLARVRDKLRTIGAPMPTAVRAVGYRLDA